MYTLVYAQQNKAREKEFEDLWLRRDQMTLIQFLDYPDQLSSKFREENQSNPE